MWRMGVRASVRVGVGVSRCAAPHVVETVPGEGEDLVGRACVGLGLGSGSGLGVGSGIGVGSGLGVGSGQGLRLDG